MSLLLQVIQGQINDIQGSGLAPGKVMISSQAYDKLCADLNHWSVQPVQADPPRLKTLCGLPVEINESWQGLAVTVLPCIKGDSNETKLEHD